MVGKCHCTVLTSTWIGVEVLGSGLFCDLKTSDRGSVLECLVEMEIQTDKQNFSQNKTQETRFAVGDH
jgi:hypothetical protein